MSDDIPTPLTDAMPRWNNEQAIPVEHVKSLERELIAAKKTIDVLKLKLDVYMEKADVVEAVIKDLW